MRLELLSPPQQPLLALPVTANLDAGWIVRNSLSGTDATAISSWADVSGNGNTMVQATGSKQPLYQSQGVGGKPSAKFDGVDDLLNVGTSVSNAAAGTFYALVQPVSLAATFTIWSSGDEASTTRFISFSISSAGILQIQQRNNDTQDLVIGSTTISVGRPWVVVVTASGTAWTLRVNGNNESLTVSGGANTGDWLSQTSARDNMVLGALKRTTESTWANGFIAAGLLYNVVHSATQLAQTEHFLGTLGGAPV